MSGTSNMGEGEVGVQPRGCIHINLCFILRINCEFHMIWSKQRLVTASLVYLTQSYNITKKHLITV